MKELVFNKIGGFPFTTDILNQLQQAYNLFNAFGNIAGNFSIISGCEKVGRSVTPGVVYINGELYPFKGGAFQTKVRIYEDPSELEFEDGKFKKVIIDKVVEFGDAVTDSFDWADFKRSFNLKEITSRLNFLEPINKEIKWVGLGVTDNDLPVGPNGRWYIANGTNGTQNILGKMIVGKDGSKEFNKVGQTGGEKTHKLTLDELPRYEKEIHYGDPVMGFDRGDNSLIGGDSDNMKEFDNKSLWLGGQDKPHNNLPPYIVEIPIQYIKN